VVVFDPWLFPCFEDVNSGKIKVYQPMDIIYTEGFGTFCYPLDSFKCTQKLNDEAMNINNEFVLLKTAYHSDLCDPILYSHMELYFNDFGDKRRYKTDRHDIYFTANQIALHYLAKLEFATSHTPEDI